MNSIFAPADELRENRVFQRAMPSGHEKSILAQTAERTRRSPGASFFFERHFVKSGLSEMEINDLALYHEWNNVIRLNN